MLQDKIVSKKAKISVIGLGYVGLPLAIEVAKSGFRVVGIESDLNHCRNINSGTSFLADVSSEGLTQVISGGAMQAVSEYDVLRDTDISIICVPTPLSRNHEPDLSYVISACKEVAKYLHDQQLVVLESTTYPGTTEEVILPMLEARGLKVGDSFFLAFSPERVDPGNKKHNIRNIPKVVGGITPQCTEIAKMFYEQFVERVVPVSSCQVAEMTKLLENIFRSVNIALVNELTVLCDRMDIDVWEVIEAASTKPFGFMAFYPGPGLGGHCVPIDPFYLSWKAREYNFHTEFIELAAKINENMPYYVISKVSEALNGERKSIKESKIFILGVAYKRDIGDIRGSPALKVIELLTRQGANITYHDPFVKKLTVNGAVYRSVPLDDGVLHDSDCTIIVTDHSNVHYQKVIEEAPLVIDTRKVFTNRYENVVRI